MSGPLSTRGERVLLAALVFAVLFAQVLLYPGIPELVAALGARTRLDASMWFLAAEFAAFVAFAGVWGAASDAAGRRVPFVVAGAVGGALGYFALALAPAALDLSFLAVLGLRLYQGAATIGAFSLGMTMLMDLGGGHGRNMGAAGIAIGGGTALGAPVGGRLTAVDPLLPLYVAGTVLLGVGVAAGLLSERAADEDRPGVAEAVGGLLRTPTLGIPYAFGFVDRLSAGFFALVGTLYFRTAFGLDAAATGVVLALFFAPFALLQYPFGVLSDRIGRTVPVVAGSLCYGAVVVAVGAVPTVELASLLMVAVGVVGALMSPATMALVTDLAPADERGAAMAGFNAVGSVGFLTGIVAGGAIADRYGFFRAFLSVGLLEVAIAALTVPFLLGLRPDSADPEHAD